MLDISFNRFKRFSFFLFFCLSIAGCSNQAVRFHTDGVNTDYARENIDSQTLYAYPHEDKIKNENLNPLADADGSDVHASWHNQDAEGLSAKKENWQNVDNGMNNDTAQQMGAVTPQIVHHVQDGDTLYSLSMRYKVGIDEIKTLNHLTQNELNVGQTLKIPVLNKERVAAWSQEAPNDNRNFDNSSSAYQKPVQSDYNLGNATSFQKKENLPDQNQFSNRSMNSTAPQGNFSNHLQNDQVFSEPKQSRFLLPLQGPIIEKFGEIYAGRKNNGIAIKAQDGTPVKAADDGVVIYAGDSLKEFGHTILIKHDDGLVTVYGHNRKLLVTRGQSVHRGQIIAESGHSGETTIPKLHFEVRKGATPIDPMPYLSK